MIWLEPMWNKSRSHVHMINMFVLNILSSWDSIYNRIYNIIQWGNHSIKYYSYTICMWEAEAFFLWTKISLKNPAAFLIKAEADQHNKHNAQLRKESRKKKEKQQYWPPFNTLGNTCLEELHENIQTMFLVSYQAGRITNQWPQG